MNYIYPFTTNSFQNINEELIKKSILPSVLRDRKLTNIQVSITAMR